MAFIFYLFSFLNQMPVPPDKRQIKLTVSLHCTPTTFSSSSFCVFHTHTKFKPWITCLLIISAISLFSLCHYLRTPCLNSLSLALAAGAASAFSDRPFFSKGCAKIQLRPFPFPWQTTVSFSEYPLAGSTDIFSISLPVLQCASQHLSSFIWLVLPETTCLLLVSW